MREPVMTPQGHTYEKKDLYVHFQTNGFFDPVTRIKVDNNLIVENKAVKEGSKYLLEKNPNLVDQKVDYHDIELL